MKRRILAIVVTLMMVINMMPANLLTSFAAESGSGSINLADSLMLSKTAKETTDGSIKDEDGNILQTYDIDLSVKGTTETSSVPIDVTLVIDLSNSMTNNNSKNLKITKDAAVGFINSIFPEGHDTRVAIVAYATYGYAYDFAANRETWNDNWDKYNNIGETHGTYYTDSKDEAIAVINDSKFTNNGIKGDSGGTNTEAGFLTTKAVTDTKRTGVKSIVVFMTDGVPTYYYDDNLAYKGDGNNPTSDTFNQAVDAALDLKKDGNIIYTVGLLTTYDEDSEELEVANKLLSDVDSYHYNGIYEEEEGWIKCTHEVNPDHYTYSNWGWSHIKSGTSCVAWGSGYYNEYYYEGTVQKLTGYEFEALADEDAYSSKYYSVTEEENAGDTLKEIYAQIAQEVNNLAVGTVTDVIPADFAVTNIEALEAAGATVTVLESGETSISFPNITAGQTLVELPTIKVKYTGDNYGSTYSNSSATFTGEFYDGTACSKDFPKPVAGLKPQTVDDNAATQINKEITIDEIANDNLDETTNKLEVEGYTVADYEIILTDAQGNPLDNNKYDDGDFTVTVNPDGTFNFVSKTEGTKEFYYIVKTTVSLPDPDNYAENNSETLESRPTKVTVTVEAPAIAVINGSKTLNGRDMKADETFSFNMKAADEATRTAISNGDITGLQTDAETVSGGTKGTPVAFSFDELTFNKEGTYKFEVTEKAGDAGGVTYDGHTAVVTVTVTEDAVNHKLVSAVTYDNGTGKTTDEASFVNTYDAADAAPINLEVTKSLQGREWIDGDSFTFTLEAYNPTALINTAAGSLVLPESVTITDDSASHKAQFGDIVFTSPGTFQLKITENVPDDKNGITYDPDVERIVTIVVTDNGKGQLIADVAYDTEDKLVFTNKYAVSPTTANIAGTKVLEGRSLAAGEFVFTIAAKSTTADGLTKDTMPVPGSLTAVNNAAGAVDFGPINFTKAGTYVYEITENVGNLENVTYDKGVVTATVEVTENKADGTLSAAVTYSKAGGAAGEGFTFTNKYVADSAAVPFTAEKSLTGYDYKLTEGLFSFTLSPVIAEGSTAVAGDPITQPITVSNDANGNIDFGSFVFTEPGTYVYSVSENQPEPGVPGITYDNHPVQITVVVTEQDNKLVTAVTYEKNGEEADAITFANTYKPAGTTAVIKGQKAVTGNKSLTTEEFEFEITAVTEDAPLPEVSKVKNNTAGEFEFVYGDILYTEPGTYVYEVKEVAKKSNSEKPGYTYDDTVYTVTVVVTDDKTTGKLKSEVTYKVGEEDKTAMTFANDYDPADATVTISGDKELIGYDRALNAGEFTFKLMQGNTVVDTAVNDAEGNFSFKALTYDKVGEHTYTIVEDVPSSKLPGVTYSAEIYTVVVNVTDDGFDGELDATVTYYNDNTAVDDEEVIFENSYDPEDTTATIIGSKTLTGRDMKADDSFTFTLEAANREAKEILAEKETVTVNGGTAAGNTAGFQFGTLKFDKEGTYEFNVNEVAPDKTEGVTYDTHTAKVTVTVTDNEVTGELEALVTYDNGNNTTDKAAFVNTYDAAAVTAALDVSKVLNRNWQDGDSFEFELGAESTENIVMPGNTTVSISYDDKDKIASFDEITFNEAGEYFFTITETAGSIAGITYDDSTYNVKVVVADVDKAGQLEVISVEYTRVEKDNTASIKNNAEFTNIYTAEGTSAQFSAKKKLEGRELKAGEFSFELKDKDGKVLQTKKNAADGTVTFDPVEYDAAGNYTYTIEEVQGQMGGVSYDSKVVPVTVTVTDHGYDAQLDATVAYGSGADAAGRIPVFKNVYTTGSVTATLGGHKTLDGRALNEGEFTFQLKDAEGKVLQEKTNAENGDFAFDEITYTKADAGKTFNYTISEVKGSLGGVTYDESVVEVAVTVTDNGDGTLSRTITYNNGEGKATDKALFTNTYAAAETSAVIKGIKTLNGRDLKADEFSFTIVPQNGAPAPAETTVKNAGNGTVNFGSITYTEAGTYIYEITETGDMPAGVTKDAGTWTATVKVTDDGKGQLHAAVTYSESAEATFDQFEFVNEYKTTAPDPVSIEAKKTVTTQTGNDYELKGGDFKFELVPGQNNPADDPIAQLMEENAEGVKKATLENDANGLVSIFDDVIFGTEGTYTYSLFEINSGIKGFGYSETKYLITVTVKDNVATAKMESGVTYQDITDPDNPGEAKELTFVNTYNPSAATALIYAHKTVQATEGNAYVMNGSEFTFKLTAKDGAPMPAGAKDGVITAVNDKNGVVSFPEIRYETAGTYEYTITEVAGEVPGIVEYSGASYDVTVVVTDDEKGTLTAVVNGLKDENGKTKVEFVNKYDPSDAKITLKALKVMEGAELSANDYEFKLTGEGQDQTAANAADGTVAFGEITYDRPGTYTYTVSEVIPENMEGIIYDEKEYTVVVKVTDKGGRLEAVAEVGGEVISEPADLTFTNIYEETEATITKVWEDAGNQDGKRPNDLEVTLTGTADNKKVSEHKVELNEANKWTATVENLPVYADGEVITYSWSEPEITGYIQTDNVTEGTETTITNSHTPQLTTATVKKVWEDSDNQDGYRPASLDVTLSNGTTVTLNEANKWTATVENLPVYANGSEIEYIWTEAMSAETDAQYDLTNRKLEGNAADGYITTLTNTHVTENTSVKVTKVWDDNNNQDGIRERTVEVQLYANGKAVEGKTATLKEINNWMHTWEDLAKKAGGVDITYTVDEVVVPSGYSKAVERTVGEDNVTNVTITNKHIPETVSVPVTKVWKDSGNQDNIRPESVKIQLLADGDAVGTVTLDADNNWSYTWTNLAKFDGGREITYTVDEQETPDGYTKAVSGSMTEGFTVTNSHETYTRDIAVNKVWNDADNQDGIRAKSVEVELKADGKVIDTVTLNADNNWKHEWTGLAVNKGVGEEIVYTVDEQKVPAGYTKEVTGGMENGFTVINSHTPDVMPVSVTKVWDDGDNQDGDRPAYAKVGLYIGDELQGEAVTLDASNNWTYTWTDLAVNSAGSPIDYKVKEIDVPKGYSWTRTGDKTLGFTITNDSPPKTVDVKVVKEWDDRGNEDQKRPDSIKVQLTANGEPYGDEVVLNDSNGWTYEWTDLDEYEDGELIDYSVKEFEVDGYTYKIDEEVIPGKVSNDAYHIDLTNIYPIPKTEVSVAKVWDDAQNQDGIRPGSVKVQLLENGEPYGDPVTLSKGEWDYTWKDLNVYKEGKKIKWTVEEVEVPEGYKAAVTGDASNGFVITNKHEVDKTEVSVTKKWIDAQNQDGMRTDSIQVQLYADGEKYGGEVTLSKDNGWKHIWTDLDVNRDGAAIEYTVKEVKVPAGYEAAVEGSAEDGFTITNKHDVLKRDISVNKVWNDNDNQDGMRAAGVKVQLYADGSEVGSFVTLSETNGWKYTWEDLDVNKAGKAIKYEVKEIGTTDGYTTEVAGDADNGFTITNTHEILKTEKTVTKVWNDKNNQDNIRPDIIKVQLYANGQPEGSAVALGEANNWTYTWTDLDLKENGADIVYTVDEVKVPDGYVKSVDGMTITNTHDVLKTEKTVTKIWDDAEDQDGIRPAAVKVQLYADGQPCGDPVTVTAKDNWTYTWTDLDLNAGGTAIVYTVDEVAVPDGYEKSVEGMTITNRHVPSTVDIPVTKTWSDKDDQDGIRPASITVRLLADGEEVASASITAESEWKHVFTGMPEFKAGEKIVYTVTEDACGSYATAVDGYDIVNSYTPGKTSVTVTKVWDDANNQDGKRTDSVTVQLLADGRAYGEPAVLNEDNSWTYTWTELDEKKAGKAIGYTVEETEVPEGYTVEISGDQKTGYIITNSYVPETTEITVYKQWKDGRDQYNMRPGAVTAYLYADGEVIQTIEISAANNWEYTVTDLPVYADGKEIAYTVTEKPVDGYESVVDGYKIVNTVIPPDKPTQTGDGFNGGLYGALALMAALTGAGVVFGRRRREDA